MKLDFFCKHSISPRHDHPFRLNVDFSTEIGCTALFGPSGSGKTTLLSMLAGLVMPTEGRIALDGQPLLDTRRNFSLPPENRSLGVVFQHTLLFPHVNVESNLLFGRRRRKNRCFELEFDEVVDQLEIRPLLKRYPGRLSGGERQRVALGRAILSGPRMLVMDEPLTALDVALKMRVLDYLMDITVSLAVPLLFVTHSQAVVRRIADRVIVLREGEVAGIGRPAEVLPSGGAMRDGCPLHAKISANIKDETGVLHCNSALNAR